MPRRSSTPRTALRPTLKPGSQLAARPELSTEVHAGHEAKPPDPLVGESGGAVG